MEAWARLDVCTCSPYLSDQFQNPSLLIGSFFLYIHFANVLIYEVAIYSQLYIAKKR